MINIFTSKYKHYANFYTFSDVVSHIRALENAKLLEDHPQFGQTNWSFEYYTPARVRSLFEEMHKTPVREKLREAYEKGLGAFEMCIGDYQNPMFVAVTEDLEAEDLRRNWSYDYLKSHGYIIIEALDIGTFQEEATKGLVKTLKFLEWLPDNSNCTEVYPYGIFIRTHYPLVSNRVAEIVSAWRKQIMVGEVV